MADALLLDEADDVAVALTDLPAGCTVDLRIAAQPLTITLQEPIQFGHKFAVGAIHAGADIRKYGEVIGRASAPIRVGEHVHVHNLRTVRGAASNG